MHNKIYFFHTGQHANKPINQRLTAFKLFFNSYLDIVTVQSPSSLIPILLTLKKINKRFKSEKAFIFLSIPPFRAFWLLLIPGTNVILDFRDGWSIAQRSGYGGTTKKKRIKASISTLIESIAIKRSYATITCTPGLQSYLTKISNENILLIPNGVSDEDLKLAERIKKNTNKNQSDKWIFCCAGQFSEYGKDKAKKICHTIVNRYSDKDILIQLIGSNKEKNAWVVEYIKEISAGKATVEILPQKNREELYKLIADSNFGIAVVRDPNYELGTKVYDYIALDLPIVNYFDTPNNFTDYFDACLDRPFGTNQFKPEISRSKLITKVLDAHKRLK